MNSDGDGDYFHTNHRGNWVNVLYRRGDVSTFNNYEGYFSLSLETFGTPARIARAIDQILTHADFSRNGAPAEAPRITEQNSILSGRRNRCVQS